MREEVVEDMNLEYQNSYTRVIDRKNIYSSDVRDENTMVEE